MAVPHCSTCRKMLDDNGVCPECGAQYDDAGNPIVESRVVATRVVTYTLSSGPPELPPLVADTSPSPAPAESEKPRAEKKPRAKKMSAEERKKFLLRKRLQLEQKYNPYFPGR